MIIHAVFHSADLALNFSKLGLNLIKLGRGSAARSKRVVKDFENRFQRPDEREKGRIDSSCSVNETVDKSFNNRFFFIDKIKFDLGLFVFLGSKLFVVVFLVCLL